MNPCQQLELTRQRVELDRMLLDMEEGPFQVAKARKEAEVLRQVIAIATIDSLQRENMRLQEAVKR